MSRKSDISKETIGDLASRLINYGKESKEKDHFWWPNLQLSLAKYDFCDSFNERLMLRSDNKKFSKNPL